MEGRLPTVLEALTRAHRIPDAERFKGGRRPHRPGSRCFNPKPSPDPAL